MSQNRSKKEKKRPGPQPLTIELSKAEREALEELVRRHNEGQQIALRARVVLKAEGGKNTSQIGRELKVSLKMVRLWRERWLMMQAIPLSELSAIERVEDLARPGGPAEITADQRCQIEALACEKPAASERPISHWTGREIADEVIKRGIVEQIWPRHASRLLKGSRSESASDPLLVNQRAG